VVLVVSAAALAPDETVAMEAGMVVVSVFVVLA
jgi:hypothetical protein